MLCKELRPNSTIIYDNAAFHKKQALDAIARQYGHQILFCRPTAPTITASNPTSPTSKNDASTLRRARRFPISSNLMELIANDYNASARRPR
jgi:hypothetical protein